MKNAVITISILTFFFISMAEDERVSGTVTDDKGLPVSGALVMLKNRDCPKVYTDEQGKFSLIQSASVKSKVKETNRLLRLRPAGDGSDFLIEMNGSGEKIGLEIFSISGTRLLSEQINDRKSGTHRVSFRNSAHSLFIIKVKTADRVTIWKAAPGMISGAYLSEVMDIPEPRLSGKKNAGISDTVIVISRLHRHSLTAIGNYETDNLEIKLSASNPWIPQSPLERSGGMVRIKAAGYDFEMGQPNPDIGGQDYSSIEQPVHTVSFTSDFWMDTIEVTQSDYDQLMASAYEGFIVPETRPYGAGDRYPVYDVGWTDAVLYCNARSKRDGYDPVYSYDSILKRPAGSKPEFKGFAIDLSKNGYRLPTEAEWEYACRGGTFTDYFWGKNYDQYLESPNPDQVSEFTVWQGNSWNLGSESPGFGAHPVASGKPNPYGLYDMAGNVTEHCTDWYSDYSYGTFKDPFTQPVSGQPPMLRGGHWGSDVAYLRSANRSFDNNAYAYLLNGFRTVRLAAE
ncbi:MAG: SUMF1/EgtB/PvdO family nonheme iron enzyme [Fibrobacter sp.]|nr:SUMF1/EgtB/PvdO family nonheme iron enzyme [Fibrobacter sp.]